jgi:putative ABC transport system ATP-binding protein
MALFDKLHGDGQTLIVVTHEHEIAERCHRVITLKDGHLMSDQINQVSAKLSPSEAVAHV